MSKRQPAPEPAPEPEKKPDEGVIVDPAQILGTVTTTLQEIAIDDGQETEHRIAACGMLLHVLTEGLFESYCIDDEDEGPEYGEGNAHPERN